MSSDADVQQDDWQPPTEAELKVLQARRERSNKISQLMGDYLLKGYRMLGVCCQQCETILLQDKQGTNYCVACQELDADNVKDDPALSDQAALRQVAEHSQRSSQSSDKCSKSADVSYENLVRREGGEVTAADAALGDGTMGATAEHREPCPPDLTRNTPRSSAPAQGRSAVRPKVFGSEASTSHMARPALDHPVISQTLSVLYQKMQNASNELRDSDNINNDIALCQLVKCCAEAIDAVHRLQQHA